MFPLLITSSTTGSGKTSIAFTLALYLQSKGKKVTFIKPVTGGSSGNAAAASDVVTLQYLLNLAEPAETLSPFFTDNVTLKTALNSLLNRNLSEAEVVIIESPSSDLSLNREIAVLLDAKILGVEVFQYDLTDTLIKYNDPENRLAGVVVNKVPDTRKKQVAEGALKSRIRVLGIIPEDRHLAGFTVRDLADGLNGEIISGRTRLEDNIENFIIGALNPDHGSEYYARKSNKAVILRSERADMQLSALETPSKCLVLAGPKAPVPVVLSRAETRKVPVISVKQDVPEVLARLEGIFRRTGFTQQKASRTIAVFNQYLDLDNLYQSLK